ncbi:MAG: redoxin domain-containing protein [Fimbriiglobus sp.]
MHPTPRFLLLAAFALAAPPALAADTPADRLNQRIENLAAIGPDGKLVPIAAAADGKAAVVVFLSFDCPVSNSYAAPLTEMAKAYADRGMRVFGVVPGDDAGAALAKQVADFKLGFPVLADPNHAAADALGAVTVPEAFVLDAGGVLRYRGRIDDAYSARLKRNAVVTSHDLTAALDAVLAGKPVPTPTTKAVGCPIFRPEPTAKSGAVTYYRDVAPILQANCQGCHRAGQVGPFALTSFKHAVAWADDIKDYTHDRRMPPWKPVGGPGYKNDRRMTDADIATLAKWVDAGCPEGDPKSAPPPAAFADEWQHGEPDLVLTPSADFHVGATGRDMFRCFVLPTGLTVDKFVVAFEIKPGNPKVVHHTLNFWDRTGRGRELEQKEIDRPKKPGEPDHGPGYSSSMGIGFAPPAVADRPGIPPIGAIGGWAPGQRATRLPDGAGYFLPKGADIVVQTHYHRTGKPEDDRIKIGFYFAKKPIEKQWQSVVASGMSPLSSIPAGESNYKSTGTVWLTTDANVHSVMPHMHLIGKSIRVTMTPPTGDPTTLVDIPKWDYGWQETYWFQEPIRAKAGTRIDVSAVFDNSSENPNNPSHPPKRVPFGEQTTNEMLFAFVGVTATDAGRVRSTRVTPGLREILGRFRANKPDEPPAPEKPPAGAKPPAGPKAQRFDVPYRLTDTKHVLVRVKLDGKGPYNFILDTGAPIVVASKKLGAALGHTKETGAFTVDDVRIDVEGGLPVGKTQVRFDDLFQLEGMNGMGLAGVELHGVIGYTVLAKYRITYDFTADKLAWVPLDYEPPAVRGVPRGEGGGQGGLEVLGPVMKVMAGFLGITPNFATVARGRVGVELEDRPDGVVVTAVLAGSPAAKAGLRVGDRLTKVRDDDTRTTADVRKALAASPAGAEVEITRIRGGKTAEVRLTLEEGV